MSYGRNFGMRSFENIVRDGRFRVPATGTPLRIGTPVTLDTAAPGFLELAATDSVPGPQSGIVVYEHIQNKSDALTTNHDDPYDRVPLGQYAQMIHGPGAKVWFKNTGAKTLYDGRVRSAVTMVDGNLATMAVGTGLVPNGDGGWEAAAADAAAWLVVEQVNSTTGLVEARFTF